MTLVTDLPLPDAAARQAILDALDETLVVEAAAGAGKTTELVNRILRVLATGRATMIEICKNRSTPDLIIGTSAMLSRTPIYFPGAML